MNPISIQCLPSSARDANRLASRLGVSMHEIALHTFPDRELRVTVGAPSRTTIIYASLDRPNEKLIALLFAAEALRRGGARRLILLAPYLCYMRQDAAFQEGESISQKVIGHLFDRTFDRVITFDAHLHRTANMQIIFPNIEADDLSAMPAIANVLRNEALNPRTILVGPDTESRPWVSELAKRLGAEHAVAQKTRRDDRSVKITFADSTIFAGRPALVFDDIVSSGGTLIACAGALLAAGAMTVDVVITHALFPPEMNLAFADAGIRSIRSTYSVPHPTNSIILDDILVAALNNEMSDAAQPERQT